MLFLKPFYLRWENNKKVTRGYRDAPPPARASALNGDADGYTDGNGRASEDSEDGEGVAMRGRLIHVRNPLLINVE